MGRAYQVLRRTTHVTVCVAEQEGGASASAAPKTQSRGRARQPKQEQK
jgi:hypothetical protein